MSRQRESLPDSLRPPRVVWQDPLEQLGPAFLLRHRESALLSAENSVALTVERSGPQRESLDSGSVSSRLTCR